MLSAFIKAYCNNDLTALVIEGDPTLEQLQEAWNEIMFEWSYSIKSDNNDYMLDLARNIGRLQHHIFYVDHAVKYLRLRSDADIIKELRGMGYDLHTCFDDSKEWNLELDRIISLCKTKVADLDSARDEYERMQKTTEGKAQTSEEFENTVGMIARFQGYRIDKNITTVAEFASYLNAYVTEMNWKAKHQNVE